MLHHDCVAMLLGSWKSEVVVLLVVIDVFFEKREGGKLVKGNRDATCAKY